MFNLFIYFLANSDTPQNSPHRPTNTSTPGKPITTSIKNFQSNALNNSTNLLNNGTIPTTRVRRLSNSSMASDVSFRLPTYDPLPATFNLQSDLDASASEYEDGGGSSAMAYEAQLDVISKEKLFDAYKKALDRYQKYRGRYTELVRRYRDLERDNNKARVTRKHIKIVLQSIIINVCFASFSIAVCTRRNAG